jgi:hypothetical protein
LTRTLKKHQRDLINQITLKKNNIFRPPKQPEGTNMGEMSI